jgi:hypothetical protein
MYLDPTDHQPTDHQRARASLLSLMVTPRDADFDQTLRGQVRYYYYYLELLSGTEADRVEFDRSI